jgi:hypothetical protein
MDSVCSRPVPSRPVPRFLFYGTVTLTGGTDVTEQQIADLVNLLVSTWPGGVKGHVWTELLREHNPDADVARAAWRSLRDGSRRAPVPADLLEAISFASRVLKRSRPDRPCGTCRGSRFVDCLDERRHGPDCTASKRADRPCFCTAVVDCPDCSVGHPRPPIEDRPMSWDEYVRRVRTRGSPEELARLAEVERFLGHSLR